MKKVNYDADLHNHTTASDGEFSPEQLVQKAEYLGIKVLGVTDHDTVDGLKEALGAARKTPVNIMTGIEVTIRFREPFFTGSLHLLAYFSPELLDRTEFTDETDSVLSLGRGSALTHSRIIAINECFGPASPNPLLPEELLPEDVYAHGNRISRRHFALALNAMGIRDTDRVTQIIGNDSPAYVPSGSDLDTIKDFLLKWPFVIVLAHPAAGSFPGGSFYSEVLPPFEIVETLMERFKGVGLAGLEVEYPGHTQLWKERLRDYMCDNNILIETGGSDCHDSANRPLGTAGTSMQTVNNILRHWL